MRERILVIATSNKGKVKEIKELLKDLPITVKTLEDFKNIEPPEETGNSFFENALIKARYYAEKTGYPCLADDSGLVVDALGGAPGIYSSRFAGENATDEKNNEKLLKELEGVPMEKRTARFVCVIVVADDRGNFVKAEGTWEGKIAFSPRGKHGFGYDPLFLVKEYDYEKTSAELPPEEKNKLSHRARALKQIKPLIIKFFGLKDVR